MRPDAASAAAGADVATGPRAGTDVAQAAARPQSRTTPAAADNGQRLARPVRDGWTVDGRTRRPAGTACSDEGDYLDASEPKQNL
jgi:hypothetical protein